MNPEQRVIDAIDELVNELLAHGPTDDYERPYIDSVFAVNVTGVDVKALDWGSVSINEPVRGTPSKTVRCPP